MIITRNIIKQYPNTKLPALNGVNLEMQAGEFVAVMGSSGSGKSTLLHILGGLDSPDSGEVQINGQRIDNMNETQRAILRREKIGFVFQFFNLIGNLTVADNIEMPALIAGVAPREAHQRRDQLLVELGISDKGNVLPSQLSGGQQQRVALARALINRPAVLLADEPTGNLDSRSTQEVLMLLQEYHAKGQTILMVTHDARVASLADRVITMRDGQIQQETTLETAYPENGSLAKMMQLEI